MEAAEQRGMDMRKLMPAYEVGEAVWSAKESPGLSNAVPCKSKNGTLP